ncbi:MAG: hypothetical protein QXO57_02220 [Candidatus Aenigmatarchaeota archaeon]
MCTGVVWVPLDKEIKGLIVAVCPGDTKPECNCLISLSLKALL